MPSSWVAAMDGADYQARVQWIQVSQNRGTGKVGTAPIQGVPEGDLSDDLGLESRVDGDGATVLSQKLGSGPVVVASFGAPISSNGTGDFTATDLKPSSNWDVSAQTGGFAWTYPMEAPPSPSGVQQSLYLEYTSQSVDGTTGSTNNQPSEVGDGWQLAGTGFIERTYVSCSKDDGASGPVSSSGDLCWKSNNATMSFGVHSGPIVRDTTTGIWRLEADDGSRIESSSAPPKGGGETAPTTPKCWRLTTTTAPSTSSVWPVPGWTSGTETTSTWTVPVFGNDTGGRATGDVRVVVVPAGVAVEPRLCRRRPRQRSGAVLPRGDQQLRLKRHDRDCVHPRRILGSHRVRVEGHHGVLGERGDREVHPRLRPGWSLHRPGPHQLHHPGPRQLDHHPHQPRPLPGRPLRPELHHPLLPRSGGTHLLVRRTVRHGHDEGVRCHHPVPTSPSTNGPSVTRSPDRGDGTSAALWLTKVTHTGHGGGTTITEPDLLFTGATMQNRVWTFSGNAPLNRYRITSVRLETGATISVNYSPQDCTVPEVPTILANVQDNQR